MRPNLFMAAPWFLPAKDTKKKKMKGAGSADVEGKSSLYIKKSLRTRGASQGRREVEITLPPA